LDNVNRVVSSEAEQLILVDDDDREQGYLSKAACHDGAGTLHRAFSAFLFNAPGELLLQQRAVSKRLWPGYWSNSCCSHPRRGESMSTATGRRLDEELNLAADLRFVYKFRYQAPFGDLGSEHELCHVFLGRIDADVRPNEEEIAAIRFVSAQTLDTELSEHPERFTPWFKLEWDALAGEHADLLEAYTEPARRHKP
jgi:isopentenyl-diphosphate delta-isomerase